MKKLYFPLFIMAISMITISSCKKDLLEVNEEFYLSKTIVVQGNETSFDEDVLLDAISENDLIDKYADHIKSFEITEITYYINYFNGPSTQQINSSILSIGDGDGNNKITVAELNNVLLAQASAETNLMYDNAAMEQFADYLKDNPHQAMVYLSGSVNETPLDFSVVIKFKVKMTATIL